MSPKSFVKLIVPTLFIQQYRRARRYLAQRRRYKRSLDEVFTEIYERNQWGGLPGTFNSGVGSKDERIVSAYINRVNEIAATEGFIGSTFIDLGCGDFSVGVKLLPLCSHYIGVDVVRSVIDFNQTHFGNSTTEFLHLDMVSSWLPKGDVCFVRQVLQHLSNAEIIAFLPKLLQFKWVVITEHYPSSRVGVRPNVDKIHGPDIRLYDNSGVYLDEPPFNLPKSLLQRILTVPCSKSDDGGDPGVISTFLYKPRTYWANTLK